MSLLGSSVTHGGLEVKSKKDFGIYSKVLFARSLYCAKHILSRFNAALGMVPVNVDKNTDQTRIKLPT